MPPTLTTFRKTLLTWFEANRRDLPWRHTDDPWLILASEVMLQQTQVRRVIPKFEEFCRRWPTPSAMAAATPAEVIAFWSGLGYNRRALNLWKAATVVARDLGGTMPTDEASLLALPGVGAYTAAAVMAFAWNGDAVAIDTNVKRVFSRVFTGGEFAPAPEEDALAQLIAKALPRGHARAWHSALMDFGATICTSRSPGCGTCPFVAGCRAKALAASGAVAGRRLVRPQSKFKGSRRELRGGIIRTLAMAGAPLDADAIRDEVGGAAFDRCLGELLRDGLVHEARGRYSLPTHADTRP
jgi:A/G-specific adenine glycosylase